MLGALPDMSRQGSGELPQRAAEWAVMDRNTLGPTGSQHAAPSFPAALLVFATYSVVCLGAFACFRSQYAVPAGSELSLPRSVFTVANAASLTGFQQTVAVETYKPFGQLMIFLLIIGGSLTSMIVGGAAVARIVGLPYTTRRIAISAICVEFAALIVGGACLLAPQRGMVEALFQAASALGNCGVVIGAASGLHDPRFHFTIVPLAVLGGLGLPVLMEIFDAIRGRKRLSRHARVVLVMSAGIYLAGAAVLLLLQFPDSVPKDSTLARQLHDPLLLSSTISLNSRSLGWPTGSAAGWSRSVIWITLLLMLVGASPGGTGGGLKGTTVFELFRGVGCALRGWAASRMFGIAAMWLAAYLLLILGTTMYLSATEPQIPSDQILFIATSAVTNTGMSFGPISIAGQGLYTLAGAMWLGRILPLAVLWWAALTTRDGDVAVA
jgi:trk system potassium uptake protein TrkH